MLTLGNGFTVDNVTFFRDDEVKELFYFLPTKLQLVTAADGTPAFQFTLYQIGLPIQGKEQGGGFLIFTVELTEDQDLLNGPAKQEATALLRNETPIGDPVPTPRFQTVPFIGGTANLLIPQGAGQLATTVQLSRPSLFGRNTVAVVADMPFGGAQVFADTLRQGGTIASIEYDLDFEVRLPAVVIEAFISASQMREVVAEFVEDEVVDEDFWGGDTTTPVRHRTGYAETLEQHDLVTALDQVGLIGNRARRRGRGGPARLRARRHELLHRERMDGRHRRRPDGAAAPVGMARVHQRGLQARLHAEHDAVGCRSSGSTAPAQAFHRSSSAPTRRTS